MVVSSGCEGKKAEGRDDQIQPSRLGDIDESMGKYGKVWSKKSGSVDI